MRFFHLLLAGLLFATLSGGLAAAKDGRHLKLYTVEAEFADVRADVMDAIIEKGLKVDYEANVGDMLARTGADLGATKKVFDHAEMLQFCSATYSRAAMEADPRNIVFCPYVIVMFATPDMPGKVRVGYRRPVAAGSIAARQAMLNIEALLDGIVRAAIE